MKIGITVTSLLLAAGLAATPSEANSGVGLGNMYGIGGTSFEANQRLYTNPTTETSGQDATSIQNNMPEDPNPLPPGWSEHFDQSSGQYYYYNSLDGTTTWNRPTTENEEATHDNQVQQSAERAEFQASVCTASETGFQESQKVEDSPFGSQESWDPQDSGIPQGRIMTEKAVQSRPTNQESQRGDTFSLSGQMTTNGDDRQRWTQPNTAPQQVESRESLQLSNTAKDSAFGDMKEQDVPRNPGFTENVSSENIGSAERQGNDDRQGSMPNSDWGVVPESHQEQPRGGWGLPNQGMEELRQRNAPQPSSSTFERREKNAGNIPHDSQFGRGSEVQESRQVSSPGYPRTRSEIPSQERPNAAYQIQQEPPGRPNQANGAEHEQRQQVVGGNNASNGQSFIRHQHGDSSFNAYPQGQPPNPQHGSRPEGPRPPFPQSQYPNSQYPQQRSRSMQSQVQHRNPQYQQPHGNQRPPQHTNYNYNTQQQSYSQQPSVGEAVTSVVEDGTAAVKDVLGKSWQGLIGFSSRTREAMGQARDQVVTGASVAGQSISAKSTNWWGQAKSAFGSVFEKSDDTAQPQYNLSNQYGGQQPQQRYPDTQMKQGYQGQNPNAYTPPTARGQVPRSQRERYPDRHGVQGQQHQPQNGQIRRPGLQTRYDPPLPQQGQARPPPQPYQNQHQHPPRHSSYVDQQGRPVDRRTQQLIQDKHPDPWSHPGLSGDV